MTKAEKRQNLIDGAGALEALVAWGYHVHQFSDIHFRIAGRLDVWPSTKRYYDHLNRAKGSFENLERFVREHYTPTGRLISYPQ
jgi:hypothetical protein